MNKKKQQYTHTSDVFSLKQLHLYENRIKNIRLTWCDQVCNLLWHYKLSKSSIKDIGCNTFQLYKSLKFFDFKCKYYGYDIDQKFIDIGLKYFPELKKSYTCANAEYIKLRKTEVSVISATLEHVDNPKKILKNIINSTKKIIIVRTFFGFDQQKTIEHKKSVKPYNINQFSFHEINSLFKKNKFNTSYILDEATHFSSRKLFVNNLKKKARNMFILVANKI